ncbi:MAG: hypothetical protein ACJ74Z_03555 [Bryobacteraceae bacterium]
MFTRHVNRFLLSVIALVTFSSCFAQTESAELKILVQDSSQAIVQGAPVTLTNQDTNVSLAQTSDNDGTLCLLLFRAVATLLS